MSAKFYSSETLTKISRVNSNETNFLDSGMNQVANKLSLQEFLSLPQSSERYEFVEGQLKPKMSPKYKHASSQGQLFRLLDEWCDMSGCGRVCPEWGVVLRRNQEDWVPVPDITYVSYKRLSQEWESDEACPVLPELVIEIISPGQTFGQMTQKATDYLLAEASRVWVVDTTASSVTVFQRHSLPQTFWSDGTIEDQMLPGFVLPVSSLFAKKGE